MLVHPWYYRNRTEEEKNEETAAAALSLIVLAVPRRPSTSSSPRGHEKDTFHLAAEKFKELAEKYTNGSVKVTIFPNATLGDERTLLERMKMGIVDAGIITGGPIINFVPRFGAIDLPFLFRTLNTPTRCWTAPSARDFSRTWRSRAGRVWPTPSAASAT
jgi:TRAP-type C4-dicarboxylate transport system substrate-binding protein